MITLQRISTDEHMYTWAMEQLCLAFPSSERRDDDLQRQVMSHPDYRLCAIMQDKTPVGVVGYWVTPQFVYFENFCVASEKRNCGVGSAALKLLTEQYCFTTKSTPADVTFPFAHANNNSVASSKARRVVRSFILEIELPTDDLTRRRKTFYRRNGMVENPYYHIQPHYRANDPDLELMVLSYSQQLTPMQYAQFRKYLDDNVDVK